MPVGHGKRRTMLQLKKLWRFVAFDVIRVKWVI